MFTSLRGRIIVILTMVGVSIGYLVNNGIKLGLDLQGGMHLALEVDDPEGTMTREAIIDAIDRAERILRTRIDEFGVEEPLVQKVGSDRIIVELPGIGINDESRAKDLIQQSAFLEFKLVLPVTELQSALSRIDRQIVAALGVEELRLLGRDEEGPGQDIQNLIFGGQSADSTPPRRTALGWKRNPKKRINRSTSVPSHRYFFRETSKASIWSRRRTWRWPSDSSRYPRCSGLCPETFHSTGKRTRSVSDREPTAACTSLKKIRS